MNTTTSSLSKRALTGVFLVIVFFLMLFPLVNTFNQFLVRVLDSLVFLKPFQDVLIPYQVRIVRLVLDFVGIPMTGYGPGAFSITIVTKAGVIEPIVVGWNCLGWQSIVLVGATFVTGLSGRFAFLSRLEVLLFGLAGTFLLSIARLSLVFILFYGFDRRVAMLFHDYGSVILTILWLFFLWWFSYKFILEEHSSSETRIMTGSSTSRPVQTQHDA